ncbi:MAG: hypothetical protein IPM25_15050 [Chloracidobacterium sp.]|nr:hypothetical protein [Chloracidobacterium sp.]
MRIRLMLITAVSAAIVAGCTAEPSTNQAPVATSAPTPGAVSAPVARPVEASRISLVEAKKEYDAGTAVMIDVRPADVFNAERVKGALNMPYETLDANISKLPKGKKLIVYCS